MCSSFYQRTVGTGSGTGGTFDLSSEVDDRSNAGRAAGSVGEPGPAYRYLPEVKLGGRGGEGTTN